MSYIEERNIELEARCKAIVQKGLAKKSKGLRSFNLLVSIGALSVDNALLDLGASINLMPLAYAKEDRQFGGSTHQDVVTIGRQIHQISIWCG